MNGTGGALDVNYLLDSHGASTIFCDTFDLGNSAPIDVNIPGFISLKTDTVDLVNSATGLRGLTAKDNTPFRFVQATPKNDRGGETLQLTMTGDLPSWNLTGVYYVPDEDQLSGAVKVYGQKNPLQAIFTNLEGLASLLCDYLNNAVVETGVQFSLLNESSLLLTGDYLNSDSFAWFGWDLSGFNADNDSSVYLRQFNLYERDDRDLDVPEPATWALLLLGGGAMVVLRRRQVGQSLRD